MATYPETLGAVTHDDVVYYLEKEFSDVPRLTASVPEAPTAIGTYILTCTVSATGAEFSWESAGV